MPKQKKEDKKIDKKSYFSSDVYGVSLISLAIIFFIGIFWNNDAVLIYHIRKILFFLFGVGSFVIPFLIFFIGIFIIIKKGELKIKLKFYMFIAIVFVIMLLFQRANMFKYYINNDIKSGISLLFNSEDHFHGGIFSYLIDIPMVKYLGQTITIIIYFSIMIICLVIFLEINLNNIYENMKKKIKEDLDNITKNKKTNDNTNANKKNLKDIIKNIELNIGLKKHGNTKEEAITESENINNSEEELLNIIESSYDIKESIKNPEQLSLFDDAKNDAVKKEKKSANEKKINYNFPTYQLLKENNLNHIDGEDKRELLKSASKLIETLGNFGVEVKVTQVTKGPSVTRFELQPKPGTKVSKIVNLADDIALSLAAIGVRIEAPIPGKPVIGIEIPNKKQTPVFLREVVESDEFKNTKCNIAFAMGKDISGKCIISDLTQMPHLLIAGATGSGKSVCINALITSILFKYSPNDVKLLMVDPKVVELNVYNGIPHLLIPVVTDPKKAAGALNWAVGEMTRRYNLFAENNVRNIQSYNQMFADGKIDNKMHWILIIIDELADLMMVCPNDVEDYIARLSQMARAAGMHLVIATQRPSVDVITGVIKANIPSRISFAVSSQIDSRTILDMSGAEKLLGKGDMLFNPVWESKPFRVQGAFITEQEVESVVEFIKNEKGEANYHTEIIEEIEKNSPGSKEKSNALDELYDEAVEIVRETGQASTSLIQRRLRIGYNRAARIIEQLEEQRIISKPQGSKPREVYINRLD
ncbi:MAG: DNA translocase FtsK [Oscillospiraceae bacterium]|nr:DNA translocase FtsK [Oscillospiraceae bacterium]